MNLTRINIDIQKATSLFNLFRDTFEENHEKLKKKKAHPTSILRQQEKVIFKHVLEQYIKHSQRYGIDVTDTCPYKILAWSGYIFADSIYSDDSQSRTSAKLSISAAIVAMHRLLKNEDLEIENSFLKKVLRMVLSEIRGSKTRKPNDCQLGLGMNGFYMVFRTASICEKK